MLIRAAGLGAQIGALWALNQAGQLIATRLRIPVPGNVVGMCLLFALLCTGRVPPRLFARGAGLLARHYALFFVPIAVGLMQMGQVLGAHGVALVSVLVVSTSVGLVISGVTAQVLAPAGAAGDAEPSFAPARSLDPRDPLVIREAAEGSVGLGAL